MNEIYDVVILGSGPAGWTAALYCARGGKRTVVLGGETLGGQTATIAKLENYPGWNGSGMDLINFMMGQATTFGAAFEPVSAKSITGDAEHGFEINADNGKTFRGRCVILATGAWPRKLEISGARELMGKGVSYCATCDGFFYSGGDVVVLGGGNCALNDALYLADIAKNVKIVYRKSEFFRAENVLREHVAARDNIECLFNTDLALIAPGENNKLVMTTTDNRTIVADGLFVAIGHEANTDYLTEDVRRDEVGRLNPSDLPLGMFVAGDVHAGIKMQVATAVGTGCEAAMDAIAFLNKN